MNIQQFRAQQESEIKAMAREWRELDATDDPAARAMSVTAYLLSELVGFHAGWEAEWARTGKPRHYARGTI